MSDIYDESHRELQDRFDTRRLADRIDETLVRSRLTPGDREFIELMDMFFLASVDGRGRANCSYKGGDPGLVRIIDDATLAFPDYNGNGMYLSLGSIVETGQVGMLFIDFERQSRLRVNGEASVGVDDPLRA